MYCNASGNNEGVVGVVYSREGSGVLTVYRTTRHNPPLAEDFFSDKDRGTERLEGQTVEDWECISTFTNPKLNKAKTELYDHGEYLAELIIEDDGPIRVGTVGRKSKHVYVCGTPAAFLALVRPDRVIHISTVED